MLLIVYMTANSHKCGQNKNFSVVSIPLQTWTRLSKETQAQNVVAGLVPCVDIRHAKFT